jgi:hypothetical protein
MKFEVADFSDVVLSVTIYAERNEIIHFFVSKLISLNELMQFQLCQRAAFFTSPKGELAER